MKTDVVYITEDNETAFINMARRLGYSGLCCIYEEKANPSQKLASLQSKLEGFTLHSAVVSKKPKSRGIFNFIFSSTATSKLANTGFTLLFDVEESSDGMHQRHSGLNQVICKEMHLHHVAYGISMNALINHPLRSQHLGRILQNIMLCEKYGVSIVVGSFARTPFEMRNYEDLVSFFRICGISDPKKCFNYLHDIL